MKFEFAVVERDKRQFINIVRGFAAFLMLWGHCIQYCALDDLNFYNDTAFRVIYSFHMPLFMMISGYLFYYSLEKRTLKEIIVHRTQGIIQPLFTFSILRYFLTVAISEASDGNYMMIFNGHWMDFLESPWFLWSVLAASYVLAFSMKMTNKKIIRILLLIIGFGFVALFPAAERNIYMYPYFVIGYFMAKYREFSIVKKISKLRYVSFIIFPVLVLFYKNEHFIYTTGILGEGFKTQCPINLFRWLIGFAGSVFAISVFELLYILVKGINHNSPILKGLSALGEKSLQIYLLSLIFLSCYLPKIYEIIAEKAGGNFIIKNIPLYDWVFTPLLAVLFAFGIYLIIKVIEKLKLNSIIFGK